MLMLGIDTSCDDTSAALLNIDEKRIEVLTNVVSSQTDIHHKYGGIVPELASRRHIEMIWPVVSEALGDTPQSKLDAISVCMGPGLIGSLLIGCSFAKAMAMSTGARLAAVNHLEGHLLSAFLTEEEPKFPFICMVISGGHTTMYKVRGFCDYEEIGRTRDDAAGEAYDKTAKLLGLGYPGGPLIDKRAQAGNPSAVRFPRAYMPESHEFSFSGMKTAVRVALHDNPGLSVDDVAASFQEAMVDVLVRKAERAMKKLRIKRISISGGVAANSRLRVRMRQMCDEMDAALYVTPLEYCTDNAAMVALAGYHRLQLGQDASLDFNPRAYLPL